jgi:oligo-1,6-glucosidase
MEFWLDRGVDGFRVDTVNMYSKPPGLPDAPIVDPGAEFQPAGPIYCNGPRMHEFLAEMNAILARYGAITVGELPHTPDPAAVLRYVSAEARQLNMVFQFDVCDVGFGAAHKYATTPKNFRLGDVKAALGRVQGLIRGTDAWTTVFLENHDQARSVSRFVDDSPQFRVAGAKLLALLQACLSGTQFVYQGQEIGLVNPPKDLYPLENYVDIDSYQYIDMVKQRHGADNAAELDKAFDALQNLARDHSRIPIPWNAKGKHAGFSEAAEAQGRDIKEPWMKAHPLAADINVADQLNDPSSVLAYWRKMLRFRREHADLLVYGDYDAIRLDDENLHMFLKQSHQGNAKALVVLNFQSVERKWDPVEAKELGIPEDMPFKLIPIASTHEGKDGGDVLQPFEGRVYLVDF